MVAIGCTDATDATSFDPQFSPQSESAYTTPSQDGNIADGDGTDGAAVNALGVRGRVTSIERILKSANKRLDGINALGANPPDDGNPQVVTAADNVISEPNSAIVTAEAIRINYGGTPR